jgi:hypothetical protein
MEEWFLFHGIDMHRAGRAVAEGIELAGDVPAGAAEARGTVGKRAAAGAQQALDIPVRARLPVVERLVEGRPGRLRLNLHPCTKDERSKCCDLQEISSSHRGTIVVV